MTRESQPQTQNQSNFDSFNDDDTATLAIVIVFGIALYHFLKIDIADESDEIIEASSEAITHA